MGGFEEGRRRGTGGGRRLKSGKPREAHRREAPGALLALLVCHVELSVFAFVGIILLIGIVKKNAIMMVDFALEVEHKEHRPASESIVQAAHVRFRPIMMTTMAALVGSLPVAMATGAGAESRRPLGIVVVADYCFRSSSRCTSRR